MLTDDRYVSASVFAELAGIGRRCAAKALARAIEGATWNGHRLIVRVRSGVRGSFGRCFEVAVSSLPPELRALVPASRQPELPLIAPSAFGKNWRQHLVQSVCDAGAPGSAERGAKIAEWARTARYPSGKKEGRLIPERTIREWVAKHEAGGNVAPDRARRADRGEARVIVGRKWDAAMDAAGVPLATQRGLAEKLDAKVRSFWAEGMPSAVKIRLLMNRHCHDMIAAAGVQLPADVLDAICALPLNYIGAKSRLRAKLAHIKRTDAGGWAARYEPRIRRTRDGMMPGQFYAADVRHSDRLYRRPDGSLATPKMVCFLDLATNRFFQRTFLLEKNEGVRREHVLSTLRDLMADPSWGIPLCFYIDNGSEFRVGQAVGDLARIVELVRSIHGIELGIEGSTPAGRIGTIRSKPYTPQSKVIEGLFSNLTRTIEPMLSGYIGGNRMAKKVENQGRAPVPMKGDAATIVANYADMAAFYNALPQQKGHIKGKSPNEAFAACVADGWRAVIYDPSEFELAFGKDDRRQVQTGGAIQLNNRLYRSDKLLPFVGESVAIRIPILGSQRRIPVFDDKRNFLCAADEDAHFAFHDVAGAREQGRRRRAMAAVAADVAKGTARINLAEEMALTIAAMPAPEPQAPLATVSIHPELRPAAEPVALPAPKPTSHARRMSAMREINEAIRRAG